MIDKFITYQMDDIVCPYCGYVFLESYEYIDDYIVDCINCGRRFVLESEESVTYTTAKVDWLEQWREYNSVQIYRSEWQRHHNQKGD